MIVNGFIVNEVISLTETLGTLGVVKNDAITKMIEILKTKTGGNENE